MLAVQLGESANELVAKWGNTSGYRYGFPDFYAAQFPVRPMYNDQSRLYSGVIGRHYPNAQTGRYHYMFDQNMYLQPGNYDPNPYPPPLDFDVGLGQPVTSPDQVTSTPTPVTAAPVATQSLSQGARFAIATGILAAALTGGFALGYLAMRR